MSTNTDDFSQHGRFALAFAHLAVHTEYACLSPCSNKVPPMMCTNQPVKAVDDDATHDYVQDIIHQSSHEWTALLNNPFPYELAKGATPLNGFRHYMVQDATHFEYFYRTRMEALPKSGTFQELKDFARILPGGLAAVESGRNDCTTHLGVPKDVVIQEPESLELKEFISLVAKVAKEGDYLDSIIALLPGVLGYDMITKKLVADPDTVRNTVYYTLLIKPWSTIPAQKHRTTSRVSLRMRGKVDGTDGCITSGSLGCKYEVDFTQLASPGKFPAYNILPLNNGLYTIRSYRRGNPYLVSSKPSSVTTSQTVTQEEGLWKLTNCPDGYSIQNVKEHGFLTTTVKEPLEPVYGVYVSIEDYRWSINTVEVKGPQGESYTVYQLLVPGRLEYVLDAGNESDPKLQLPLSRDTRRPPTTSHLPQKVYVSNNARISSQFWLLDPLVPDPKSV